MHKWLQQNSIRKACCPVLCIYCSNAALIKDRMHSQLYNNFPSKCLPYFFQVIWPMEGIPDMECTTLEQSGALLLAST